MPTEDDKFTAREVATLFESLRGDISVIAEEVRSLGFLREGMSDVKDRLSAVEVRLTSLEDGFRITIPGIFSRLGKLEKSA